MSLFVWNCRYGLGALAAKSIREQDGLGHPALLCGA
jgi:hypothetical protein